MSHRFKPKKPSFYAPARLNENERKIRRMAAMITSREMLESIIAQAKPEMQERIRERLTELVRKDILEKPLASQQTQ